MKIAIIGAGFYGVYFMYKLSRVKGLKVEIFEKNSDICQRWLRKINTVFTQVFIIQDL